MATINGPNTKECVRIHPQQLECGEDPDESTETPADKPIQHGQENADAHKTDEFRPDDETARRRVDTERKYDNAWKRRYDAPNRPSDDQKCRYEQGRLRKNQKGRTTGLPTQIDYNAIKPPHFDPCMIRRCIGKDIVCGGSGVFQHPMSGCELPPQVQLGLINRPDT